MSTAAGSLSRKAKDESLHEFEFILPIKQLYWVGLIGFEDDAYVGKISKILPTSSLIFVGGDVKYRYEKLKLCSFEEGEIKLIAEFDFTQNTPKILEEVYSVNVRCKILNNKDLDLSKYQLIKGKFVKMD